MKLHIVTGLWRSGSTLLCNILNQRDDTYASSTSPVFTALMGIENAWSNSPEYKNLLNKFEEETKSRQSNALKGFIEGYYSTKKKDYIFDKSREWLLPNYPSVLRQLYPDLKIIVVVRDLRNVYASIEKANEKEPFLALEPNPADRKIWHRLERMCSRNIGDGSSGAIYEFVSSIMDSHHKNFKHIMFVKYEDLTEDPEKVVKEIYEFTGMPDFKHDFNKIKSVAEDCDGFYLNKFPHSTREKIEQTDNDSWKNYITNDMAQFIMDTFPEYNEVFGYK